jgi:hypothetical protein
LRVCFVPGRAGYAGSMEETQNQPRVGTEASEERPADESQARQASTAPLSRLLANPRRIRRA